MAAPRPSNRPNDQEPGGYYPGSVAPSTGIPRTQGGLDLPELPDGSMASQAMARRSQQQAKNAPKEDPILAMLRSFFEELNKPFDPNDPEVQSILQGAQQNALQSAGNAGIFGPYSQNLAQQAYFKAAAPLAMQRKGMAANALGMFSGASQNQRDFDYGRKKDDYQAALDQWRMDQDRSMDLWKLGGGIVGGIGGGIMGIPGGPAGIAAGAGAGWNLGSQAGGAIGQGFGSTPAPKWQGGGY